jgi:hypothetical protein
LTNYATVAGGLANTNTGVSGSIGGGQYNKVAATNATVGGGSFNGANAEGATVGGGLVNAVGTAAPFATVAGGKFNEALGDSAAIGGGDQNKALAELAVVAGGYGNTVRTASAAGTAGGGWINTAAGLFGSTVAGGIENLAGSTNANTEGATVSGGMANQAIGNFSTVPGGSNNIASGTGSFAAGVRARATNDYSFVWGGSPDVDTLSTNTNSFTVRAPGGVRLLTSTNNEAGQQLTAGGSSWATLSDSNAKTAIEPVDHRQTLARLATLPVSRWRYKHDPTREYIGPMAQDFHAAFGLGDDDRHISTLDTDGITLSAIKGLVEELREQDEVLALRENQIRGLEKQVEELRAQSGL